MSKDWPGFSVKSKPCSKTWYQQARVEIPPVLGQETLAHSRHPLLSALHTSIASRKSVSGVKIG